MEGHKVHNLLCQQVLAFSYHHVLPLNLHPPGEAIFCAAPHKVYWKSKWVSTAFLWFREIPSFMSPMHLGCTVFLLHLPCNILIPSSVMPAVRLTGPCEGYLSSRSYQDAIQTRFLLQLLGDGTSLKAQGHKKEPELGGNLRRAIGNS